VSTEAGQGDASRPDLTLAVLTYNRPQGLADTLRSCLAQTNALGLTLEVVVVDNHPSGNGAPVCEAAQAGSPWPIRYVSDLSRNMSVLRNRGFQEARGRYAAVIDDDEVADPHWTDALVQALRQTGADIAVGPRYVRFAAGGPPPYDPSGSQFIRDFHLPDLAPVEVTDASGKPQFGMGTGNSAFDLQRCFPDGQGLMREAFGDAGGEDAELFVRLHRQGRRIVWAQGAHVTETVPENRTTVAYRLLRTRRETQHYVAIYLDGAANPQAAWLALMAKGLIQVAAGALIAAITGEFGSDTRLRGRLLMAHGQGKLSWRRPVGYIAEPAAGMSGS
jgi:succinoglycan biosynthesis protein ExoM